MIRICKQFGILAIAAAIAGCAGTPVALGNRSSDAKPVGSERTLTSKACGFQLLLVIPIGVNDRLDRAYQQLQGQAGGDYVTDVKIQESWTYAFVGTNYCTTLQARAIRASAAPVTVPPPPAL